MKINLVVITFKCSCIYVQLCTCTHKSNEDLSMNFIKLTFGGSPAGLFRFIATQGKEAQVTHLVRSNLDMQILSCVFGRKKHCGTM